VSAHGTAHTDRWRRPAVAALLVVAVVATILALVAGYVRVAAVDSDQFANRATQVLRDDSVRTIIAERVTDELVLRNAADLTAARPLIESVVSSVVGGAAFTNAFRAAVRDVHRAAFHHDEDTLTLTVADVGTIVGAALQVVAPKVAQRVETSGEVDVLRRDIGTVSAAALRITDTVRILAQLLFLVAVLAGTGALLLSRDRRRTVVHLGAGLAAGGFVLIVALAVLRTVALDQTGSPDARAAVGAIWDAFLGDLRTAAWIVAGAGAVVAAAAASLIRPADINAPLRRAGAWVATEPAHPALRVLRGAGLVTAGLVCVLEPVTAARVVVTAVGLYLIYVGVSAVLWLINQPRPTRAERRRERAGAAPHRARRLVGPLLAAALIAGAVAVFVGSGGTTTASPPPGPCEGHRELCGRSLDAVALPATHNSMSVPLPGWYSEEQDHPIAEQLHDGVRGLLIDTHYADRLDGGKLRTYVGDPEQLRRQAQRDGVSPDAIDAAMRIRERLGFAGEGERGMYLCHSFCELGGTPLGEALDDLHDFLVANPGEIVVVINQDYVTPADFVGAVRDAGLEKLVYRGPVTGRWPTLRRMIDTNQRVVFLAENHAGAAPWYHLAYAGAVQETPYAFSSPGELVDPAQLARSCRPNRGSPRAPLFLVNHWITTDPVPLPSYAEEVNADAVLQRRLRECERLRDHIPHLVAVNFYRRGALFQAVDALNGVR